jgi:NTP pyrophosphatase (non-canonical NTP hydrolase)
VIALIHSELSEALEDHRNGAGVTDTWYEYSNGDKWNMPVMRISGIDEKGKPCGIPSELADVCIRIFDICGEHGIDLEAMIDEKMAYNATRPNRHGGKTL